MSKLILILAATAMLTGCFEPVPEKTTPESAQELVDSMVFVKSKRGLCFGVGTISRMSSSGGFAMGNVVVPVDCKTVGL